jgi:hypothetical protein
MGFGSEMFYPYNNAMPMTPQLQLLQEPMCSSFGDSRDNQTGGLR